MANAVMRSMHRLATLLAEEQAFMGEGFLVGKASEAANDALVGNFGLPLVMSGPSGMGMHHEDTMSITSKAMEAEAHLPSIVGE